MRKGVVTHTGFTASCRPSLSWRERIPLHIAQNATRSSPRRQLVQGCAELMHHPWSDLLLGTSVHHPWSDPNPWHEHHRALPCPAYDGRPRQRSRMHTLVSRRRDARASRCRLARSSHTRCMCSRPASRAVPFSFEQPRSPACLRSRSRRSARRSTCSTRTTPARSTTASSRPRCAPLASRSRRRSSAR